MINEVDILRRAKYYMDCLSNGINPLSGEELMPDCEITGESFEKCFSYISGVLGSEIERRQRRSVGEARSRRQKFYLSDDDKQRVTVTDEPVGINTVAARINEIIDQSVMRGVSGGKLAECLVRMGYLTVEESVGGGHIRCATEKGIAAGIETVRKTDSVGKVYRQNVYSAEMQHYLINNINEIIEQFSHEDENGDGGNDAKVGFSAAHYVGELYDTDDDADDDDDNDDIYGTGTI